jgi:CheY-like chemotaxis protein
MIQGKLLIVEDKPEEQEVARNAAENRGFQDIVIAQNLEKTLNYIPNVQAVTTDLFFPKGAINVDAYIQRILPLYVVHAQERGKLPKGSQSVLRALEKVSGVLGMTPEQYVENIMAKQKENQGFIFGKRTKSSSWNFSNRRSTKI